MRNGTISILYREARRQMVRFWIRLAIVMTLVGLTMAAYYIF